jgi:hypothetical protein
MTTKTGKRGATKRRRAPLAPVPAGSLERMQRKRRAIAADLDAIYRMAFAVTGPLSTRATEAELKQRAEVIAATDEAMRRLLPDAEHTEPATREAFVSLAVSSLAWTADALTDMGAGVEYDRAVIHELAAAVRVYGADRVWVHVLRHWRGGALPLAEPPRDHGLTEAEIRLTKATPADLERLNLEAELRANAIVAMRIGLDEARAVREDRPRPNTRGQARAFLDRMMVDVERAASLGLTGRPSVPPHLDAEALCDALALTVEDLRMATADLPNLRAVMPMGVAPQAMITLRALAGDAPHDLPVSSREIETIHGSAYLVQFDDGLPGQVSLRFADDGRSWTGDTSRLLDEIAARYGFRAVWLLLGVIDLARHRYRIERDEYGITREARSDGEAIVWPDDLRDLLWRGRGEDDAAGKRRRIKSTLEALVRGEIKSASGQWSRLIEGVIQGDGPWALRPCTLLGRDPIDGETNNEGTRTPRGERTMRRAFIALPIMAYQLAALSERSERQGTIATKVLLRAARGWNEPHDRPRRASEAELELSALLTELGATETDLRKALELLTTLEIIGGWDIVHGAVYVQATAEAAAARLVGWSGRLPPRIPATVAELRHWLDRGGGTADDGRHMIYRHAEQTLGVEPRTVRLWLKGPDDAPIPPKARRRIFRALRGIGQG